MYSIGIRYNLHICGCNDEVSVIEYSIISESKVRCELILSVHLEILNKMKCISDIEIYL